MALQVSVGPFWAVRTRLELATSGVTGRHSNQLNYRTPYVTGVLPRTPRFDLAIALG